jgi:hypothetical protein
MIFKLEKIIFVTSFQQKLVASDRQNNNKRHVEKHGESMDVEDIIHLPIRSNSEKMLMKSWWERRLHSGNVDRVSRYLFPLTFLIFSAFYTYKYAI